MGEYTDKLYALLDMPATDSRETINVGTFCPADTPEIVEELTTKKLEQLAAAAEPAAVLGVSEEHQAMMFHTYTDYLKSLKLEDTTRSDLTDRYTSGGVSHVNRRPLEYGHSLDRGTPDHAGYLKYLQERKPQIHSFLTNEYPARIMLADRKKHTLILGGSGFGKSELMKQFVHAHLRNANHTVVVLDPHGEMAGQIARWQENAASNRLVLIDTTLDEGQQMLPIINPLHLPDPTIKKANVAAQALTDAFTQMLGDDGELTRNMKTLLHPCLVLLMMRQGSTLLHLLKLVTGKAGDIEEAGKILDDPMHKLFFEETFKQEKWNSTKDAIATRLQYLLQAGLYRLVTGKPTVDLRQMMNSRRLIVFKLSEGDLGEEVMKAFGFGFRSNG